MFPGHALRHKRTSAIRLQQNVQYFIFSTNKSTHGRSIRERGQDGSRGFEARFHVELVHKIHFAILQTSCFGFPHSISNKKIKGRRQSGPALAQCFDWALCAAIAAFASVDNPPNENDFGRKQVQNSRLKICVVVQKLLWQSCPQYAHSGGGGGRRSLEIKAL